MNDPTEKERPMTTTDNMPTASAAAPAHYKKPDWFTRTVFNRVVKGLTRMGVSVRGSRVLEHRGRTTGKAHHVPVNLLTIEGKQYLVAPRGETQWVRNVRAAEGRLVLILGRHRQACTAREIPVSDSVTILRAYLRRWKFETGMFFDNVTPDSTDAEWAAEAPNHPVFEIR
jgi:deazaflavin-dependent oxidoreductase (nitroreductase family)